MISPLWYDFNQFGASDFRTMILLWSHVDDNQSKTLQLTDDDQMSVGFVLRLRCLRIVDCSRNALKMTSLIKFYSPSFYCARLVVPHTKSRRLFFILLFFVEFEILTLRWVVLVVEIPISHLYFFPPSSSSFHTSPTATILHAAWVQFKTSSVRLSWAWPHQQLINLR